MADAGVELNGPDGKPKSEAQLKKEAKKREKMEKFKAKQEALQLQQQKKQEKGGKNVRLQSMLLNCHPGEGTS